MRLFLSCSENGSMLDGNTIPRCVHLLYMLSELHFFPPLLSFPFNPHREVTLLFRPVNGRAWSAAIFPSLVELRFQSIKTFYESKLPKNTGSNFVTKTVKLQC